MVLGRIVGKCLGKEITVWTQRGGKSLLVQKPIKVNTEDLKLCLKPLERDTVQFTQKVTEQTSQKADKVLQELRENYNASYIEERCPDIVENVAKGKISDCGERGYLRYKMLEKFSKENPEAFALFGVEKGNSLDLQAMVMNYGDVPIKIAKDTPVEEIRQIFKEIDAFAQKQDFEPTFEHYMNGLIMKKYNPETYKYLTTPENGMSHIFVNLGEDFQGVPSVTLLKSVTPEQLRVMRTDVLPPMKNVGFYVESSDEFIMRKECVEELSRDLAKCKLSSDVTMFRGDKTVGMFDSIEIDESLKAQVKKLLEANKEHAKTMKITEYTGRYNCGPSTNLYDFLSSKSNLTLADAMQVAKYGDEKFINEIIARIQSAKVVDTRFKSFSIDEGMARGWRCIHAGDNTTIVQRATLKQGTQGGFHQGDNAQYEVILNNTPKEITSAKVVYNKDTDTFELDTMIRNI